VFTEEVPTASSSTKDRLLDEAMRLFGERGYDATSVAEIERSVIEAALKETRGNRRRAADMLGIGERTLYRKIKEYGLTE